MWIAYSDQSSNMDWFWERNLVKEFDCITCANIAIVNCVGEGGYDCFNFSRTGVENIHLNNQVKNYELFTTSFSIRMKSRHVRIWIGFVVVSEGGGAVAGIVIGCLVGGGLLLSVLVYCLCFRKKYSHHHQVWTQIRFLIISVSFL